MPFPIVASAASQAEGDKREIKNLKKMPGLEQFLPRLTDDRMNNEIGYRERQFDGIY